MRLGPLLFALSLSALCLHAQSASPPNEPLRLLQSPSLREKAWGAWYAGASHNPALRATLLTHLRLAQPLSAAQRDTEAYVYVQSLFDALIQNPGPVPNDVILPFESSWRAEILILLARDPAAAGNESALLAMRQRTMSDAESDAINDLLFAVSSKPFFQLTLQEIKLIHTFVVTDQPVLFCGGSVGCGEGTRHFPKGFPPIALYQLWSSLMIPGDSLFLQDPAPIYYRRVVIPTNGEGKWTECQFSSASTSGRQMRLAQFFASVGGLSRGQSEQLFNPRTTIEWHDSAQTAAEIERALTEQAASLHALIADVQRRGLIDVAGKPFSIKPTVQDVRRAPSGSLPAITPRQFVIQ